MMPERCSIREHARNCPLPPEYVISIKAEDGEYMVGVACDRHKNTFMEKLEVLKKEGKVPQGVIRFDVLKPVGTNCVRIDPDDLIQL